jgi:hypothetical protein
MSYNPADDYGYEPCIKCDWSYNYYELVKELALEIVKEENANNGPDEQWLDSEWFELKDFAVERAIEKHNAVDCCPACDHKYDLWDI